MRRCLVPVVVLLASAALAAEPEFRSDGFDAAAHGMGAGHPLGTRFTMGNQQNLVGVLQRHLTSARTHRAFRAAAMDTWHEVTAAA